MKRWLAADETFIGAYGFAHFGKSLFWLSSEVLFVFFLTEVCAMPARQVGAVIGGSLLFSAFADLAVARHFAARMSSTAGAARLQLIGTVICALALLLFSWTGVVSANSQVTYALVVSLLFRVAYALIDVPQNAILSLATRNDAERTHLSSLRFIVGGAAALCVSGLVTLLIGSVGDPRSSAAISLVVAGLSGLAVLGAAFHLAVAGFRDNEGDATPPPGLTFMRSIGTSPVRWLIVMGVSTSATAPTFSKLEPYFAAYVLGSATAGGLVMAATSLGGVLSQPLWIGLARRFSRPLAIQAAAGTIIVGALMFLGLGSGGVLLAAGCGFVFGAGLGGLGVSIWAALADAAARVPGQAQGPSAAAIFGAFTFASKTALAGSVFLVAEVLATFPYREQIDGEAWPLLPIMCLPPALGAGICLVVARFVRTTRPRANNRII